MHDYSQSDICPDENGITKELSCNYILTIQLSKDWFSYCILDKTINKYIALSSYSLNKQKPRKQKDKTEESLLNNLLKQFEWLKNPFKEVYIIYVTQRSTLMPSLMFDPSHRNDYLDLVHSKGDGEIVLYDSLPKLNLYNVYSIPGSIEKELKQAFRKSKIFHYSSTLILNVFSKLINTGEKNPQMFVNVQHEHFDLIIAQEGELKYFNSFRIHTGEDLIYYFFNLIKQLDLGTEQISVRLLGEIEKGSVIEKNLLKYIKDVSFVERNDDFEYIDVFNDIPPHFFYNLLNAHRCV